LEGKTTSFDTGDWRPTSFETGDWSSDSPPLVGVPHFSDPDRVSQSSSPPRVVEVAGSGLMESAVLDRRYLRKKSRISINRAIGYNQRCKSEVVFVFYTTQQLRWTFTKLPSLQSSIINTLCHCDLVRSFMTLEIEDGSTCPVLTCFPFRRSLVDFQSGQTSYFVRKYINSLLLLFST
jgi:hypothetical protein